MLNVAEQAVYCVQDLVIDRAWRNHLYAWAASTDGADERLARRAPQAHGTARHITRPNAQRRDGQGTPCPRRANDCAGC